ncbi:hypothetical protein GRZ55_03840 [Chelativorans sp. ZYF759]|uniref:hypothetical protein n=1 Tax=Chelativorans sp. ZYF759 TaxID=2692213 RepID=UPI00145D4984|nr:hypothetical protein [Chelativorans sp. ZYF759]NMG38372.1 hypothetical protein [Chelativorans sp. ZYF759]
MNGEMASLVIAGTGMLSESKGRRWLTEADISAAVIAALEDGCLRFVGELAPFSG